MKPKINSRELVQKLISAMISHDSEEWPPSCLAIVYQPIRPTHSPVYNLEEHKIQDTSKL